MNWLKLPVGLLICWLVPIIAAVQTPNVARSMSAAAPSETAVALKQDMRKLWTDHVVWTRDYIIAALGDQPEAPAAANRLMKNQKDIGKAVATYYGAPQGNNSPRF